MNSDDDRVTLVLRHSKQLREQVLVKEGHGAVGVDCQLHPQSDVVVVQIVLDPLYGEGIAGNNTDIRITS